MADDDFEGMEDSNLNNSRPGESADDYQKRVARELAKVAEYKKALEEEFATADPDDPETARKTREKLVELVPDAGYTIAYLLKHAESETVRASLAKYVFDSAQKIGKEGEGESEMDKLIKKLRDGDATKPAKEKK